MFDKRLRWEAVIFMARAAAATIACVMALSACSPYVYNQEIKSFTGGVDSTVSSYQTGRQSVATLVLMDRQADYAKGNVKLRLERGCTNAIALPPDLPECAVVPAGGAASPVTEVTKEETAAQQQVERAAPGFDALKKYAAALTAVTDARDDTALNEASQSLLTAAASLAKASPGAKVPEAALGPASSVVKLGIGAYLDKRRLEALRATVPAVDPSIAAVGKIVSATMGLIRKMQLDHLIFDLKNDVRPFQTEEVKKMKPSEYQARLAALQSKIAAFNRARSVDPAATADAMVKAHNELASALLNNQGQFKPLVTAVMDFGKAAQQLKTSIDAGSSGSAADTAKPAH